MTHSNKAEDLFPEEQKTKSATERPLPEPESHIISSLFPLESTRRLYGLLYNRCGNPLSTKEIQDFIALQFGEPQSEAMRRLRSLREHFEVPASREGKFYKYKLIGWKGENLESSRVNISNRVRAKILAPQRCAQCGQTPLEDHVKLCVDHKIPVAWGGSSEESNLQPLCEKCNAGKRDFYATYDEYSVEIRAASAYEEPHMRIGELLKAFHGEWVPAELIGVVASMRQPQDDWQRRLRELRKIGWDYKNRVRRPSNGLPAISMYRLTHWEPWPDESLRSAINRAERPNRGHR